MSAKAETPISAASFAGLLEPFFSSSEPPEKIAVAVSGGADSMALAYLVARWRTGLEGKGRRKDRGEAPKLYALTVDHGLRPGSAKEARQVARRARSMGYAHKLFRWEGDKPAADIQAAAREARYRLMLDWCRDKKIDGLLLAHHLEDQAETFLIRLGRGSGVDGLSAMAADSRREGVRLVRPLLTVSSQRLKATLEKAGQAWIEDPSNQDQKFLRVRMREALPMLASLGLTPERLAGTAARMARARQALEGERDRLLARGACFYPEGYVLMDPRLLTQSPDEIGLRALAHIMSVVGGRAYKPRHDRLIDLYGGLKRGEIGKGRTLAGCKLYEKDDQIIVMREPSAAAAAAAVLLEPGMQGVWDGRFDVALPSGGRHRGEFRGGEVRAVGPAGLSAAGGLPPEGGVKAVLQATPGLWRKDRLLSAPFLGYRAPRAPQLAAVCLGFNDVPV